MTDNSKQLDALYPFLSGRSRDADSENAALLESARHKAAHSIEVKQAFFAKHAQQLVDAARAVAAVYRSGHRMLAMGNGGSSCDASHFAVEFQHPVTAGRPSLPAMNLAMDTAMMTAVANDLGVRHLFARQVEAHGSPGDGLIGFSTSGNSANLMAAFAKAKSIGMTTLFLDLEHKLYAFRFYTTFRVLSPMSWGAWILLIIYPVSFLQILSTLRRGAPQAGEFVDRLAMGRAITDWCERYRREISLVALPAGVLLGVYTAVLLSAFSARPFWNTGVLAPLFLVSGLSTAAALVALLTRDHGERAWFTRIDIVLIIVELVLVALFLINLATGSAKQIEALECCVMGGPYTFAFWVLFVGIGLLIPLVLEIMEMRGLGKPLALAAAVLVLFGGYTLRYVMVEVGQESTWTRYPTQYNAELLERLHR